jgi:hypothetical protein
MSFKNTPLPLERSILGGVIHHAHGNSFHPWIKTGPLAKSRSGKNRPVTTNDRLATIAEPRCVANLRWALT